MVHRVAAVQMTPRWQPDGASLARDVVELVGPAVAGGVELASLPALIGWGMAGPRLGRALGAPFGFEILAVDLSSLGATTLLQEAGEEAVNAYQEAARALGVWLVGGSVPQVGEGNRLYNAAPVISPEGEIKGWQRQTHLSRLERAWGLSKGEELAVLETPVGRLGLLLREDVLYPEVGRFLCLLGANILVHQGSWRAGNADGEAQGPSASLAAWMSRLWREVQANQVFGLESVLAGGGYRGRATIHAPLEMTPERNGILAQARGDRAEEVVVAELDLGALQAVIDHYPIHEMLNEGLYRRYFPALYERAGE